MKFHLFAASRHTFLACYNTAASVLTLSIATLCATLPNIVQADEAQVEDNTSLAPNNRSIDRAAPAQVSGARASYTSAMSQPLTRPEVESDETAAQQKKESTSSVKSTKNLPRIYIGDVRIVGNERYDDATLKALVQSRLGKRLSFPEILQMARAVEDYYKANNYQIVKVSIPKGGLTNSVLTLHVAEGKLGSIDIQGNNRYSKEKIAATMQESLVLGKIFSIADAERPLVLLNTYPGLSVSSALSPGDDVGTTKMTVLVREQQMLTGSLEVNNFGSKDSGEYRVIPYLALLNPTGIGDKLSVFASITPEELDTWSYQLDYALPINNKGTFASFYYGRGQNTAGNEFELLDINGESNSWGMGVSHKQIWSAKTQLEYKFMFDSQTLNQDMLGMRTMDDSIRKLRIGADFSHSDMNGKSFVSLYLHQGLGEYFGGMDNRSNLSSRAYAEADNKFTKFVLSAMRLQSIADRFYGIFNISAQASFSPLVSTEQIYIGGANSVRGQPYSMAAGDEGIIINFELRYNVLASAPSLQLATFFDCASVHSKKPMLGQRDYINAAGIGAGLRSMLYEGVDLRLDIATPVGRKYGDDVYVYGQIRYSF